MALPISVTAAACVALALAPAIVGFSTAVGAAFVWVWWLERHPEPNQISTSGVSWMSIPDPQDNRMGSIVGDRRSSPHAAVHRVLVYLSPQQSAGVEIRAAGGLADRLGGSLVAAYVVTGRRASKQEHRWSPDENPVLRTNISLAEAVGATIVKILAEDESEGVIALAAREGFTHAVFGYAGELGSLLDPESTIGAFASRCRGVQIEVVTRLETS
jgi:K+-sensing histidine kinase KdpD